MKLLTLCIIFIGQTVAVSRYVNSEYGTTTADNVIHKQQIRTKSIVKPRVVFQNETSLILSVIINRAEVHLDLVPTDDVFDAVTFEQSRVWTKKKCHFKSTQPTLLASISNCDGRFNGIIVLEGGIYVLQPLLNQTSSDQLEHEIFKRETPKEKFCGLNESHVQLDNHVQRDDPAATARLSKLADVTVELAVIVDSALWSKYLSLYGGNADAQLQDFVVASLNNMQILYQHPTIVPKVNFKVVRYEVLKSQPADFYGSEDAQTMLDNFCNYQYRMSNRNWDHSLLFTGYDLSRNGNDKSISGIARLRGVCDSSNACTVAEGLDFTGSFIATHEIGHSLGMRHDEPYCTSDFVMSGSLGPGKVSWSTCSVTDFQKTIDKLDYYGKNCLRQTGSAYAALTIDGNNLPGQKFSADKQCELMHGSGYHQITPWSDNAEGICYMLWCSQTKYGRIITSHPALEGTNCQSGKYCIRGSCTTFSTAAQVQPQITDGGWSAWTALGCSNCKCSPVIGGIGVLKSERTCSNPAPANGGRDCAGEKGRGIVCSAMCPSSVTSMEDYMRTICTNKKSEKNDHELTGSGTQLTSYDSRACKVFCDVRNTAGQKSFRAFGDVLPDGTSCGSGKFCVNGDCLALQCGNTALIQAQSTCPSSAELCPIANIASVPVAAPTTVAEPITVAAPVWSEWSAWSSCSTTCGSGTFSRSRACSSNGCAGSAVEATSCNLAACPVAIVTEPAPQVAQSQWSYWSGWGQCSTTCGRGQRRRSRSCKGAACAANVEEDMESCGFSYCPWSEWSSCSATCGQGHRTKYRFCPGGYCKSSDNLGSNQTESCTVSANCPSFMPGNVNNIWLEWSPWSACSVTCGSGSRSRNRYCAGQTCPGSKDEVETCTEQTCPTVATTGHWYEWSDWSRCTQTCNVGTMTRNRQCSTSTCDGASSETSTCNSQPCGNDIRADDVGIGQLSPWMDWTSCSVTCGKGLQYRRRICHRGVCKGEKSQEQSCYYALCAQWGGWSAWSNCDDVRRTQKRIRNCYGAGSCIGSKEDFQPC